MIVALATASMTSLRMGRTWLVVAGCMSAAMALFHLGIVLVGVPAYRRFDAGMAEKAAAGSLLPAAMVLGVAVIFALFAFYAFAGAGLASRPPLLRTILVLVSLIYGLHGLFVIPELLARLSHRPSGMPSNLKVDAVFLAMAVPYIVGTLRAWPELRRNL